MDSPCIYKKRRKNAFFQVHNAIEKLKNIMAHRTIDSLSPPPLSLLFLSFSCTSLSFSSSRPAVEVFQHSSGQFPTQTESLVYSYSTGYSRTFSYDKRSTFDEQNQVRLQSTTGKCLYLITKI